MAVGAQPGGSGAQGWHGNGRLLLLPSSGFGPQPIIARQCKQRAQKGDNEQRGLETHLGCSSDSTEPLSASCSLLSPSALRLAVTRLCKGLLLTRSWEPAL